MLIAKVSNVYAKMSEGYELGKIQIKYVQRNPDLTGMRAEIQGPNYGLEGLSYGQWWPPSGGTTQVKPLASCTVWKSLWRLHAVTSELCTIKGPLGGVGSVELQFGPREPMKDVFPNSSFPLTVKFRADEMAMPYPKAPVSLLFKTVPE